LATPRVEYLRVAMALLASIELAGKNYHGYTHILVYFESTVSDKIGFVTQTLFTKNIKLFFFCAYALEK
jgi:hypothetical protein